MVALLLAGCVAASQPSEPSSSDQQKVRPPKKAQPEVASGTMNESTGEVPSERNGEQAEAFRIVVKKSERKLYLYEISGGRERLRKTYQIALGNNPTGHKTKQGDGATPEGDYYITHRNAKSNYYLSLGVSYPNIHDADEGLKHKLITADQHKAVVNAINTGAKPPQNTKLGGDIFIHGGGTGSDWTLGCVALANEDIRELFETVPVKTKVRIEP